MKNYYPQLQSPPRDIILRLIEHLSINEPIESPDNLGKGRVVPIEIMSRNAKFCGKGLFELTS